MKIYCLCLVKNEDDVLEEVVTAAARWADAIFISDNQSSDGTPEVIAKLTRTLPNVFDAGASNEPFSDDLRAKVFQRVSGVSRRGDWWCRLDADEFYIDDPREFLRSVPPQTDTVWSSHMQFYFTDEDQRTYRADPQKFLATPVRERVRYYQNNSSEIRFVKHTVPFIWYKQWPRFRCAALPRRIRLAHYQYRSPEQIARRLEIRRQIAQRTKGSLFPHEMGASTQVGTGGRHTGLSQLAMSQSVHERRHEERIMPAAGLDHYAGDGQYVTREAELPPVRDVWPTAIPFFLWKPYCILRASLSVRRLIPRRIARLFTKTAMGAAK